MFKEIFKWARRDKLQTSPVRAPENQIAYVIGDIHGCLVQLKDLLDKIEVHSSKKNYASCVIVFLGDVIDRGPHSKEVIDFLIKYNPNFAQTIYLMGNHEEMFLQVIKGDVSKIEAWFAYGGQDCARSYGAANLGQIYMQPEQVLKRIQDKVPQTHIQFVESFQDYYVFGDYLCVHAGIQPGVPLEKQTTDIMRWIRKPFLAYKKTHPYKVIHGHSVVATPQIHNNRIAIDTGAYKDGPLTAACLHDDKVVFLQSSTQDTVI